MVRIIFSLHNTHTMHKILLLLFGVFILGFRADGQVFDAGDCPRGPQVRIPITSLTKSPHSNMMVLTDSCRNQYYVHPDSVFTNGVIEQYFSGDTLITILQNGDTLISQYQMITNVTYLGDTLCVETSTGDIFCVEIVSDGDTTSNGRFRLLDNFGTTDSIHIIPSPASPETLNITNALRINPGQSIKWGGRLVDATTTVQSMDSTHNITYQDVNIMRHYGASMRFYPWDRFLIDGSPNAYIDMRSRTSFYVRADTVLHLDLFQHGLSDSSYLLIRTTRLRKSIAKKGAVLQLLQHAPGTHQGNADWTPYQLPLSSPSDTGIYSLQFQNGEFNWIENEVFPGLGGSGTVNYVAKWTPNDTTLGISQIFDNGTNVGINENSGLTEKITVKSDNSTTNGIMTLKRQDNNITHKFFENGRFHIGKFGNFIQPFDQTGSPSTANNSGGGIAIRSIASASLGGIGISLDNQLALSGSNNYSQVRVAGTVNPSSGSGRFYFLEVAGIVNQSGSASGATGGVYVSTSLTNAIDWRSFDTDTNSGRAFRSGGSASSWHKGKFKIGTDSIAVRDIDVTGTARVTGNVDTASLSRLWAGNPQGDLKRVWVGDGLGFVNDTLKVSYVQLNDDYPYIQANVIGQYNDTIAASNSKIIKFNTQGNVKDWVLDSNWIEYQGLDTFMMKLDCNITLLADAATTFQITFHSDEWGELFGYEMALNGGTQTLHVADHLLFPVPYIPGAQPSDLRFSIWIKNTSANQRIFTVRSASLTAIRVGRWIPEFNP